MNASDDPIFDAVIVGGGPAGLSAALVLGRSRRKVIVFDSGQPRNTAANELHGFLGHDGIAPLELLALGRSEIAKYGVELISDLVIEAKCIRVEGIPHATLFQIRTKGGRSGLCRKLLFATGMRDELPEFPGVRDCYGATIHHCPYCDGWEHRDKRILVYGKSPSEAAGLALAVRGWSDHVTLLANGDQPSNADKKRLKANGVTHYTEPILRFNHEGDQLRGVELEGQDFIEADAMFFHTTQHSTCELPATLGVESDSDFTGRTSRKQKTNVPGVFLAGDADGHVEFAIVAAAEGATAAVAMNRELQEEDQAQNG
jgi:thioredoxin reductase